MDNKFAGMGRWSVTIAGCGGTGGFVAEGLCRLLPDKADIILVDHDRVEEGNLGRQNFAGKELGMFKSEALALRLSTKYNRAIGYSVLPIAMVDVRLPGLIIGCLDNGPARRAIAELKGVVGSSWQCTSWWIDAGNGENYGQVLIGNSLNVAAFNSDTCFALPLPTIQSPELLAQAPQRRSCAQMDEQGPTINQAIASLVIEVTRKLITGTCHWMQLYLDLEAGTLYPVMATPETAKRITKVTMVKGGE